MGAQTVMPTLHNISGQIYATAANGTLVPIMSASDIMTHHGSPTAMFQRSGPIDAHQMSGPLTSQPPQFHMPAAHNGQTYAFITPGNAGPNHPGHGGSWGSAPLPPPPPPGPPPPQLASYGHNSFGHGTGAHMHPGSQMPQQQFIQRTGNVHDGLRQQGCLYIPYDGPLLDRDACANGKRLKAASAAGLVIASGSPSNSPSSSHGSLPSAAQALHQAVPTDAAPLNVPHVPEIDETTVCAPSNGSVQVAHFFVSSFPTEKMECAQQLLTRVLQTVASGANEFADNSSVASEPFIPWVESIAFMNPSSRGSSHSFYAKVHVHDPQTILERIKGGIMMDRMGFHWAVLPSSRKHLEQYSKAIWNLPQVLRHRRTEWLPCTPLILDLAMDTTRLKWQVQL